MTERRFHGEFAGAMAFGIRTALRTILASTLLCGPAIAAVSWVCRSSVTADLPVPNEGQQQTCCVVCDLDNDGVDDFVIGERTRTPSVVWYKYNGTGWNRYVIDDTPLKPEAGGSACDIDRFKKFYHGMLQQGVYLAPSAFEAGFVSNAHSDDDIADTLAAADKVLATL